MKTSSDGIVFLMTELREAIVNELSNDSGRSIIKVIDLLVAYAYELRASDIHIDPTEEEIRVRMRIDGVLNTKLTIPSKIHDEIISRIKVLAGLRTDEHQAAQDGRFRIKVDERTPIDIRVSIAPTYYGENAVLRLLIDTEERFTLESLGFSKGDREKIENAMNKPTGMILATGPTGSGKTTTLYTILKTLNTEDVSIITIEDPIEYAISGIEQIQVNSTSDLTFANGLRSILRQDPNIIMVGEIRDRDTASIAVNTALTGHLLLSTLHTNDASTTLPRLLDVGVEPYLVASTVNIAIGQRLVRRICSKCAKDRPVTFAEKERLKELAPSASIPETVKEGNGCSVCSDTGYKGRISINEVLVVGADVREAILKKASSREIHAIAVKNGMTPMIDDGIEKVKAGCTTFEEILRVVQ